MLLYMDEVAGYLPPNGNPPTKAPIMLLLKQARAFGVGVVLSTQNPVDVDYKALSNAGTWMIGRLQTEQDKARLVDGLTSAAGSVDPGAVGDTISGLGKREFVMKRASRDTVSVFTTRWAMSYLRGPLTRQQITSLKVAAAPRRTRRARGQVCSRGTGGTGGSGQHTGRRRDTGRARVPRRNPVHFLDPAANWAASVGAVPGHRLVAGAIARVLLRFDDAKAGIVHDQEYEAILKPLSPFPAAHEFRAVDYDDRDLLPAPRPGRSSGIPRPRWGPRPGGPHFSATWQTRSRAP